jgi:hypothetical protein
MQSRFLRDFDATQSEHDSWLPKAAASLYLLRRSVGVTGEHRDYRQLRNAGPGQAGLGVSLLRWYSIWYRTQEVSHA